MLLFITLGLLGFAYIVFTSILGDDSDTDGDIGDFDHDISGSDDGEEGSHILSIFSPRVIASFLMGFGGAGALSSYYGLGFMVSSIIGIIAGILIGALIIWIMKILNKQQSNSLVKTSNLIGVLGVVDVPLVSVLLQKQNVTQTLRWQKQKLKPPRR